MVDFEQEYLSAKTTPSDFYLHLPMLRALASVCDDVIEFGVRTGISTRALLVERCHITAYDVILDPYVKILFQQAAVNGRRCDYLAANTLSIDISPTDMLVIDTDHTYYQLHNELLLHGNKARKFIAFHDTAVPYGGETLPAIFEFMSANKQWQIRTHTTQCHGFTVLERKYNES